MYHWQFICRTSARRDLYTKRNFKLTALILLAYDRYVYIFLYILCFARFVLLFSVVPFYFTARFWPGSEMCAHRKRKNYTVMKSDWWMKWTAATKTHHINIYISVLSFDVANCLHVCAYVWYVWRCGVCADVRSVWNTYTNGACCCAFVGGTCLIYIHINTRISPNTALGLLGLRSMWCWYGDFIRRTPDYCEQLLYKHNTHICMMGMNINHNRSYLKPCTCRSFVFVCEWFELDEWTV